jgi:hypothetical protein
MPRKVFTAGEVLAAADVNEFLMDQSVQSFAGTAARGSAIPSPVEGMYTHLEDTDRLEFYNGSAWLSPFGYTLITSNSYTSTTNLDVDNVFTSEFDVYEIVVTNTGSSAVDATLQLRVSGTTAATAYDLTQFQASGSTPAVTSLTSQTSAQIGRFDGSVSYAKITLAFPFLAQRTIGMTQSYDTAGFVRLNGIEHVTAASYTGFRLNMSSTTGTLRVYGLRK